MKVADVKQIGRKIIKLNKYFILIFLNLIFNSNIGSLELIFFKYRVYLNGLGLLKREIFFLDKYTYNINICIC